MSRQLLLIINEDKFFLSHRTQIAIHAREKGWDVTLVTKDTGSRKEIEDMGFKYLELPINPTGMNPKDELRLFKFFVSLFRKNPDAILHLVGLKNMLWGGLASKFIKTKGVLYAVSGLGTLFGENKSFIVSSLIQNFLRFSMRRKNVAIIFQNHDDEALFKSKGIGNKCFRFFIKGSGVDLNTYVPGEQRDSNILKVIFTARMLREKGVEDLIAAAEILRPEYEGKIEFLLCGDLSDNPNALSKGELESMVDGQYVKWLGHRTDIPQLLAQSDIMCFPSFYREGVPKSLIEASACGLPLITTDSVGCRDTVVNKKNGYLIKPHSPGEIAKALRKLIQNPDKRKKMGLRSRQIAEKEYDVNAVAAKHLEIYNLLYVFDRNK